MLTDPLTARMLIVVLAVASAILHAHWVGEQWRTSDLSVNFARIGITVLYIVVAVLQIKAVRLTVPVDIYTWALITALILSTTGFGARAWDTHRRTRRLK